MDSRDIRHRFEYHPPQDEATRIRHEAARQACMDLAFQIDGLGPDSREKSTAITKLEECMFWTNAMIARGKEGLV